MNSVNMILEGNGMISSRRRCAVRKGVLTNFAKIHRETPVPEHDTSAFLGILENF